MLVPNVKEQVKKSTCPLEVLLLPVRFERSHATSHSYSLSIYSFAIIILGERCIDKVVMQEETEYDEVVTCKHSYSEKCHKTYVTDFEPQQEEDCEETFTKSCFIEYKKVASTEPVKFCHTPLICNGPGEEVCRTEYTSVCTTTFHVHEVTDDVVECKTEYEEKCEDKTQGYSTTTECTKWPKEVCTVTPTPVKKPTPHTECKPSPTEVCGPLACKLEPGPEECFDKQETVVQEVSKIEIGHTILAYCHPRNCPNGPVFLY